MSLKHPSFPSHAVLILLVLFTLQACAVRSHLCPAPDREGILLVAFGTSRPQARAAFAEIEKKYREAFPGIPVEWAYTSHTIRKKLAGEGTKTANMEEALGELAAQGVNVLRVQSLHIMAGEDFSRFARGLVDFIHENPHAFKGVYLGRPLLESRQDGLETARLLQRDLARENTAGSAVIFMSHGQRQGRAGLATEGAQALLKTVNPDFYLATVEGERDFAPLMTELKKKGVKKVFLAPFMLVAGEHAREDLAGRDDASWASQLEKAGFTVTGVSMKGLGEREGIADIFTRHTRSENENLLSADRR